MGGGGRGGGGGGMVMVTSMFISVPSIVYSFPAGNSTDAVQ